ncbi:MAG: DnaD domain protein [Clostridiales bacterium]|nr:DnaD domain protein [Clostridiales bacterium]
MNYFRYKAYNEDLRYTPVENIFINHYMPNAPGEFVKVYLLGLKCSYSIETNRLSDDVIAKTIGISPEEVKSAWQYWEKQEIINIMYDVENQDRIIEFIDLKEKMLNIKGNEEKPAKNSVTRIIKARQNIKIREMFDYIRKISGRELSQNEIFTFLDWIEDYNFPPEIVVMIIEDCYSRNKKDLPYLKQVAKNWFDAGVDSQEKAIEYANRHKEKWQKYSKVLNFLRVGRQPTAVEEEMLYKWFYEYSFSDEAVLKACELTVKTLKPSFSYIDKVLTEWYEKNLKTLDEIEAYLSRTPPQDERKASRTTKRTFNNFKGRTYDTDLLKQRLLKKSRGELSE